jgi:phosphoribosylanthranilate isomerase
MFLKICGITSEADGRHAARAGATAIGFVFWARCPRYVEPDRAAAIAAALPEEVARVGVFVDASVDRIREVAREDGLTTVQLHGHEAPAYVDALELPILRAARVEDIGVSLRGWPGDTTFLLDAIDETTRGGTGEVIDWSRAAAIARSRRVVLAGGLSSENVETAITMVHPFGVDVSSGVEDSPGVKDPDKVTRFLANARRAFEACQ